MVDYDIEPNFFGFGDALNIYAGDNTSAPLISSVTGVSNGSTFEIYASSPCVTIEFISDGFTTGEGFELTWACNAFPCVGSSPDNPTIIGSVPYTVTGLTTCSEGSTVGESPCPDDNFLWGPDYVFTYDSPGDECVSVTISGAEPGTGVLVLNGPPGAPGTTCVAQNGAGMIGSANFNSAGTYYIIVGNAEGCTDFDIDIEAADCNLSPALVDALCNPLNGCQEFDMNGNSLPSTFNLDIGFEDLPIVGGLNNGCYLNTGAGNFYWFTIQAQAVGNFGFIVDGANFSSDIDLSVWGPFTEMEVCETPADVIDYITNNQPIRSSWSGGADPTGLADIHPILGTPVLDEFDCGSPATPGAGGDDFVRTIQTQIDEVYVVLINDWGGQIVDGAIEVDWSPSDPEVLESIPIEIVGGDTTVCEGESVQIEIIVGIADIEWISNTGTLSCTDCPNPIATPTETTIYLAVVDGVCIHDTVAVKVGVYQVDAGPDLTVCLGEDIQIVAGSNFDDATYEWVGPNLSCTDCPDPIITGAAAGTFIYSVTLFTPNCTLTDEMELTVLTNPAPVFSVVDSVELCIGDNTNLGDPSNTGANTYVWSSDPPGYNSADPNPIVSPTETITYYVEVSNGLCPVSSFDSVYVEVFAIPILNLEDDTTVCQGEMVTLGNTLLEAGVSYNWTPNIGLDFDTIPNPTATINSTQTYTLTAINGACVITESVTVTSTVISVDLQNSDSLLICKGEEVNLNAIATPFGIQVSWTPDDGSINPSTGNNVVATPQTATTYFAYVSVPGCEKFDSIYIDVDSIPSDLQIFPSDTSVCAGSLVVLQTTTYEQFDFPDIQHQWQPNIGFQSPDSLLNMVIEANEPVLYTRTTTNGICTQIDSAQINIFTPTTITIMPIDTIVCTGESVQLVANSPDVTEYTWTPDNGTLSCIECPDPIATPSGTSTYTVEGEFEDCPVEASVQIEVIPNSIAAVIGDMEICIGESIVLNELLDPYPGTTWSWNADPPDPTLDPNDPLAEVTPLETTTYSLTVSNGVCDPLVQQVTITVVQDAILTISEDITICEGDATTLTANSSEPGGTFLWSNGDETASINVSPNDTTEYSVLYSYGCGDLNDSVTVNVIEGADVEILLIDPDPLDTIFEGDMLTLTAVLNGQVNGATYEWSTGQTSQTITTIAMFEPIEYTVTVTSAEGCQYTYSLTVDVLEVKIGVPNVFTPDGDGDNDYFTVFSNGTVNIRQFRVFNRWGQIVYNNETPDQGWDGTYKNENAPSDVYIYDILIEMPSGVIENRKGDLTLLR